jgi:hypothetical protein
VALAAGTAVYNESAAAAMAVQPVYLLLGFLSYKAAVLDAGWKALKAVTVYAGPDDAGRPRLAPLPDVDDLEAAAEQEEEGPGGGARLSALAAALSLCVLAGGITPGADAALDKGCAQRCVVECLKLAPGSKDYCEENCALACDSSQAPALGDVDDE